jgi:hypothetical protein
MSVDINLILYGLPKVFNSFLSVDICHNTKSFLESNAKIFNKLDTDIKIYYLKYSLNIAQCLSNYLMNISIFELNTDLECDIVHDFKLKWGKNKIAYISLSHYSINVKDIIPDKLMKICKYSGKTNICKNYKTEYNKINNNGYKKIKSNVKYSDVKKKTKDKEIFEPVCELVVDTLSRKRKCAEYLYNHLFNESDRIVFKLYKNKYTMYDFGKKLNSVESFKMKSDSDTDNIIIITFNNNTKFKLCLQTNATEIKEHLSLKFHTTFVNIDEIYLIESGSI